MSDLQHIEAWMLRHKKRQHVAEFQSVLNNAPSSDLPALVDGPGLPIFPSERELKSEAIA